MMTDGSGGSLSCNVVPVSYTHLDVYKRQCESTDAFLLSYDADAARAVLWTCLLYTSLAGKIELNVVDGIILPNLKMAGAEDGCGFLTEEGRCGIHPFRPGICRLFPLGRYYEENGFRYFLQVHECQKENREMCIRDRCISWLAEE